MVSVYTHIKPFQKRAIDFFRSCLGEIGKEGQIRSVLDELFRKQAFYKELLASFGPALTEQQRVYIEGLAADVETSLDTVLIEQTMLQRKSRASARVWNNRGCTGTELGHRG